MVHSFLSFANSLIFFLDCFAYGAQGLLLRSINKPKGQYERVGHVHVAGPESDFREKLHREAEKVKEEMILTESMYESYDVESQLYTFPIF